MSAAFCNLLFTQPNVLVSLLTTSLTLQAAADDDTLLYCYTTGNKKSNQLICLCNLLRIYYWEQSDMKMNEVIEFLAKSNDQIIRQHLFP